jgi:nucleoside recognition membrane protein YjiH
MPIKRYKLKQMVTPAEANPPWRKKNTDHIILPFRCSTEVAARSVIESIGVSFRRTLGVSAMLAAALLPVFARNFVGALVSAQLSALVAVRVR